mmetsp:Transcript_25224/g.54331  ORF Transcript_25224/g.54331 Transcript_25224/m.54331 type:complete len:201 (-) Transcript_25224:355-957(-)
MGAGYADCGGRTLRRIQWLYLIPLLVPMRAKYNRTEFAVTCHALQTVLVLLSERVTELSKQMPKKARVGNNGNTLLRARIEPLEKLDGPLTTVVVRFAIVAVKSILIVPHFREVKIRELRGDIFNGTSTIADVMPPTLPTLLTDQDARRRDWNAGSILLRILGRHAWIQECGRPRGAGPSENVAGRLARSSQWRDNDEIE